jgi:hypothetical protein
MDTNEHELKHLTGRQMQIVSNLPFKSSIRVNSCPFAVGIGQQALKPRPLLVAPRYLISAGL